MKHPKNYSQLTHPRQRSLLKKAKLHVHLPSHTKKQKPQPAIVDSGISESRRTMLKQIALLPFLGTINWACQPSEDEYVEQPVIELEGEMPTGILAKGKPPVSRLILGTNPLSGNAHARDLIYPGPLLRAYNTEKKILETYLLAEQAGINLFFLTSVLSNNRDKFGSNIQTWKNVSPTKEDIYSQVDQAIDQGVDYIMIQGATCDRNVAGGQVDVILKCLDYIKKQGCPAGLGAHTIQAMQACVDAGADPDFYYKTMHHDQYWSAHPKENRYPYLFGSNLSEDHDKYHDNMWCLFPEETVAFIQKARKPVVGFKVLAAGAIPPKDGFQWAFDNGADFIEVGMLDFQIVDNVNQTILSVEKAQNRTRPWF
jgi:hypothetical protein